MASEPKKRKFDQLQSHRTLPLPSGEQDRVAKPIQVSQIGVNMRIQQAKNLAIAQAQQDGCTGHYRIFDSPFGNYLVPVVPTRKDLSS